MAEEIINRITKSPLMTIDLEELYPIGKRVILDISQWLYEGLIVREKDFRKSIQNHDWEQYKNSYVALTCETDAIVPSWSYMLITTELANFALKIVVGDLEMLETIIFQEIIASLDTNKYKDKPVIIKGCSEKPIPETAQVQLIEKLLPTARTIMFGEACSTVPLYKRKK